MTICVRPAICVVSGSFFQIYRKIFKRLKCGRQFSSSSYWKSSKWGRTVGIVSLHTLEFSKMANCVLLTRLRKQPLLLAPSRSSPLGTFREDERNETSPAGRSKAERLLSQASVRRANEEGAWEIWAEKNASKQTQLETKTTKTMALAVRVLLPRLHCFCSPANTKDTCRQNPLSLQYQLYYKY